MTEEELAALEEDSNTEAPKEPTTTEESEILEGEEEKIELSPEEKAAREKKRTKQGLVLGSIFMVLLIIGVIGAIIFSKNKDKIFGLEKPVITVETPELPNVNEPEVVIKKELATPEEDTGVLKEDIYNGVFTTKAYIQERNYSDKWFKCETCRDFIRAKDIYIKGDNTVYFVGEDGYLYSLNTYSYIANLIDKTRTYTTILNSNLFRGEDGVFYSFEIVEEKDANGGVVKSIKLISSSSKVLRDIPSHSSLESLHSFRPNINDNFLIGEGERYYSYENDKAYLLDEEGNKTDLLFTLGNDEELVYIANNVIKTTKMFYSIQSIETDEGFDYKFYPDTINKYYSQVKYYNGNIVIDTRYNVYFYGTPKGE